MTKFLPFKGFLPVDGKISDVALRSMDFGSDEEILEEMQNNPLAYLHVTKSNLLNPGRSVENANYFEEAVRYVQRLLKEGHIAQDGEAAYYLYRQSLHSGTFIGIIGLCDVLDYQEDTIKRHESTRLRREEWVARLVKETRMVGEPVLIAHNDHPDIQNVIGSLLMQDADVKFSARENSLHELWRINGEAAENIREVYEHIASVYIMDGHHRSASFSRLYRETGEEQYRYFLGMMLSSFNIRIWPFHRLIKLTDRRPMEFFDQIKQVFTVEESEHNWPVLPDYKGTFGLYLDGRWYQMRNGDDREVLDVTLLENKILKPILGIHDSRSDERLEYLPGNHTIEWMQKIADSNPSHVLVTLHPCQFEDIQRISDAGDIMPPKSTYIEPKGLPGLVIQQLD